MQSKVPEYPQKSRFANTAAVFQWDEKAVKELQALYDNTAVHKHWGKWWQVLPLKYSLLGEILVFGNCTARTTEIFRTIEGAVSYLLAIADKGIERYWG